MPGCALLPGRGSRRAWKTYRRDHKVHPIRGRSPAELEARVPSCAGRTGSGARSGWCSRWARRGLGTVWTRSTVYRVLIRNQSDPSSKVHGAADGRTTRGGSARSRCSCGSWT